MLKKIKLSCQVVKNQVYGAPNERANWQTISTISAISPISAISAIQIFPLEAEPIYSEAIPTHVSNHLRAIQSYP